MKIAIFAQNNATEYSGGRYHSWMMAEALAHAGHEVYYITNNKPVFYDDFSDFPNHLDIHLWDNSDFYFNVPSSNFDVVVLVPTKDKNPLFFIKVRYFAENRGALLSLLNFETPNWFNLLSTVKTDPVLWINWKKTAATTSLILSSAKESVKFAKKYFDNTSPETLFAHCYPSINSIVADSVNNIEKEKRIILITRFGNSRHKGGFDTAELISEAMRGYTLVFIIGSGTIPSDILDEFRQKADEYDVNLDIKYKLTDFEKFIEIKRASLMLFPSFFEGFGYPPVEAQYCNTPCIVFDLPVLREVSGDGLVYIEYGNWNEFRNKISEILRSKKDFNHLKDNIAAVAKFESFTENIDSIFIQLTSQENATKAPAGRYLKQLYLLFQISIYNLLIPWQNVVQSIKVYFSSIIKFFQP